MQKYRCNLNQNGAEKPRRFASEPAPFQAEPDYLLTAEVDTDTRTIAQLAELHDKHAAQGYTARRLYLDMQTKIVNPLLCILFMMLSVPFSVRLGRGNVSVGLSVAILLGVGYMIIAGISQSMGYSGQLAPGFAAWLPFGVYSAGCAVLISRTPT